MSCERNFGDILSILAVPVVDVTFSNVAAQFAPTVTPSDYTLTLTNAIYIGRSQYRKTDGTVAGVAHRIPIVPMSGDLDDSESTDVGGRLHTVQVKAEIELNNSTTARAAALLLERGEYALEVTFFGDEADAPCRMLIQATQDTYLCTIKRDGRKTTATFTIQNLMGAQVVEVDS